MGRWDRTEVDIGTLVGKTLIDVQGCEEGSDEVTFVTDDGKSYRMYHYQDCCESVSINDIVGDVQDLIGYEILRASEDSNEADGTEQDGYGSSIDHGTWTFYNIRTVKGAVTLRWLGQSNGYYSESVSFEEVK